MRTGNVANSYVSRAEGKLAGAVRAFSYDFRDKTVLDIGSSTGGFTELALKLGAKKVVAIEKGTKQMKAPLRFDTRIELHEKTDFFDTGIIKISSSGDFDVLTRLDNSRPRSLEPAVAGLAHFAPVVTGAGHGLELFNTSYFNTILADVSFVSLKKILVHAKQFADRETDFLVMLKPQFEARREQLWNGVVKNEKMRREIIKNFEMWLKNNGFVIVGKRDNDVVGKNGNRERFYYLKLATKS